MAECAQQGSDDKNPLTTSDLGSSCDNDLHLSPSCDVNGCKLRSDDVISVDGSASLTLDSLEEEPEEEEEEEEQEDILPDEEKGEEEAADDNLTTANMLNLSEIDGSFYLHRDDRAKIDTHKHKCQLSELAVHSEQNTFKGGNINKQTSQTQSDNSSSEHSRSGTGKKENKRREQQQQLQQKQQHQSEDDASSITSRTESDTSSSTTLDKRTLKDGKHTKKPTTTKPSSQPAKNKPASHSTTTSSNKTVHDDEASTTTKSNNARENSEPVIVGGSLSLRKTRSLTEQESSTDPHPSPKTPRRTGIPRRRSYDQQSTSSPLATIPQRSPGQGLRRSLTLNSASLSHRSATSAPSSADASPCSPCGPASFPSTPVKTRQGRLRRSASQSETMSVYVPAACALSASVTPASRTTITSRLRFEKNHQDHDAGHGQGHIHNHGQGQGHHHGQGHAAHDVCGGGGGDAYLTPFQRKDLLIKEMRAHVKDLNRQVEARERQIEELRGNVEDEKEQTQAKQRAELEEAGALAESARKEVTSLKESHGESVRTVASLQQQLEDVKRDMAEKLASAEDIFLEMYKKGRESAIFEREEELELQGKGGRSLEATEQDLRNKLVRTQAELAKWQTLQRHESYHTSPVPGTEAETTLRFLKDSVFHFLVSDRKTGDEHLRAIVRILRFSEVQREKIAHAIIYRRNKTSW